MKSKNHFRIIIITVSLLAFISILLKAIPVSKNFDNFFSEEVYRVTYRYFFKTNDKKTTIKTYLPKNNTRQRISAEIFEGSEDISFKKEGHNNNIKGIWSSSDFNSFKNIDYQFTFEGKTKKVHVTEYFSQPDEKYNQYLIATEHIQVNDPVIDSVANSLISKTNTDRETIQHLFDFVYKIPAAPIITLTDAVSALDQNRASCNGKSRLFVAIARNLGYPARVIGGIVLEKSNKRTSHAWTEVNINNTWVPFDPLNNHFASLPANYLELYEGDEFLITYTSNINFDYIYEIEQVNHIPFLKAGEYNYSEIVPMSLLGLIENNIISRSALMLLLILPIGGILVAFLRNVVGIRTFGTFLPVLIAHSLIDTGLGTGILLFVSLILFVGIVSILFSKLGLLQTPKLVISLSLMVLVIILSSFLGMKFNIIWLTSLTFFPTIIVTISAERFSTLIVEDGFQKATATLFQTLVAVVLCYLLLVSEWTSFIIILFPEFILIVIVIAMLLGRYIGFRWTELFRFRPILSYKTLKV